MQVRVESYPDIGLTVARGAIDPTLTEQLEAECHEIVDLAAQSKRGIDNADSPHKNVNQVSISTDLLVREGFLAATKVLKKIGAESGRQVVVNQQLRDGVQAFHTDDDLKVEVSERKPIVTFQLTDGGSFDYLPLGTEIVSDEEAEKIAISIPVNAGDVVVQTNPNLKHRGKNKSGLDRFNMVVFSKNGKPLTIEEAATSLKDTWQQAS